MEKAFGISPKKAKREKQLADVSEKDHVLPHMSSHQMCVCEGDAKLLCTVEDRGVDERGRLEGNSIHTLIYVL